MYNGNTVRWWKKGTKKRQAAAIQCCECITVDCGAVNKKKKEFSYSVTWIFSFFSVYITWMNEKHDPRHKTVNVCRIIRKKVRCVDYIGRFFKGKAFSLRSAFRTFQGLQSLAVPDIQEAVFSVLTVCLEELLKIT